MAFTGTGSAGVAWATASAQSTSVGPSCAVACSRCRITVDVGLRSDSSIARSSSGLYSMTRLPSMPQDAETTTLGPASSIRTASSLAANPPKTTEWTAPRRAQASIAIAASGTIGM